MRVAALYDIHGNLPAFGAVLEDVLIAGEDQVVVGGDVVLGPMPRETLACLRDVDVPVRCIRGNCDREVLAQMVGTPASTLRERVQASVRWVAKQLHAEDQLLLANWPGTARVEMNGVGAVLFCHATPRNDTSQARTGSYSDQTFNCDIRGTISPVLSKRLPLFKIWRLIKYVEPQLAFARRKVLRSSWTLTGLDLVEPSEFRFIQADGEAHEHRRNRTR